MKLSPELQAQIDQQKALLKQAADVQTLIEAARKDPEVFFRIVPRQERTNRLLSPLPHQKLHLAFMRAHPRSVSFLPVNHGKTIAQIYSFLFDIGNDPELRCAFISATQGQAKKILHVIRDNIDNNPMLHLVFPHLKKGRVWTDQAFKVQRDSMSKDYTCIAFGIDGGIQGSRLDRIYVDDILNRENTATKAMRETTLEFVDSSIVNRLEGDGRISFNNTAWHTDDVLHVLAKRGWATMRAAVDGNIYIKDDVQNRGKAVFDHPLIQPTGKIDAEFGEQVRINDPGSMLWVDHPQIKSLEWLHDQHPVDLERNRAYYSSAKDENSAYCKKDWIENCKKTARLMGFHGLTKEWKQGMTFTGLDLAFSESERSDDVCFFTFGLLPSKHRLILDIQYGKWDGPTILDMAMEIQKRYDSVFRVESNVAQKFILQFARERDITFPVRPHFTGKNKNKPETGVQSMFVEIYNGAWIIPNDQHGRMHPHVARWVGENLDYQPTRHVGDGLMAAWFAREQAREWGVLSAGGREVKRGPQMSMQAR